MSDRLLYRSSNSRIAVELKSYHSSVPYNRTYLSNYCAYQTHTDPTTPTVAACAVRTQRYGMLGSRSNCVSSLMALFCFAPEL